jgi:hypothetical protein
MILRMPTGGRLAGAMTALVLCAAGCGGGDDAARPATTPGDAAERATPEREAAKPGATDPAAVRVVRAWADTLRRGDVRRAARYFAIPSVVSNATAPIRLETRAEAVFFNRTLPCGARLIGTEPAPHGFFIATFRLTERPGRGRCGTGTGETARTAFRVRDGHITHWLRVRDVESAPETLS